MCDSMRTHKLQIQQAHMRVEERYLPREGRRQRVKSRELRSLQELTCSG